MSCEKIIEPDGIWCRYFGSVTNDEVDQIAESIRVDANLSAMRYVVSDFSAVTEWNVTAYDVLLIASHDHNAFHRNTTLKLALISATDDITSTLNRYLHAPIMTFDAKLFSSLSDARDWLAA